MKQQRLNEEMVRYFAGIKPRHHNPTFLSSNVGASMGTSLYRSQSMRCSLPSISSHKQMQMKRPETPKYIQEKSKTKPDPPKQPLVMRPQKSKPNLINQGIRTFGTTHKSVNDKMVYEKQSKKYNIITIEPKEYVDSIRIFPKLRLQHQDEHYLKRQISASLISTRYNSLHRRAHTLDPFSKKLSPNPEQEIRKQTPPNILKAMQLTKLPESKFIQ